MEEMVHKLDNQKNGVVTDQKEESNVLCKPIENYAVVSQENITIIDLSARNIKILDDNVKLPVNLAQLNLSHNKIVEIPSTVLKLEKLEILNLAHNMIKYFNDCPHFCHSLEQLDMSFNRLEGPPYWIWLEMPEKLTRVNLSNNIDITKSFKDGYFEELLQYSTLVTDLDLHNCNLSKFTALLVTFSKAKSLYLGTKDYSFNSNSLIELPCEGLDKCSELKSLNVCNTHIYTVTPKIEMHKSLVEINLANNDLNGIPNEFCNLENLETCILSWNKILYVPEEFYKLQKLVRLYLNGNILIMIPDKLCELTNLKTLDLYDNNLNEAPENFGHVEELDLAQNYFEEPKDAEYLEKKERLRLLLEDRYNGRKNEPIEDNSAVDDNYSTSENEDDEELYDICHNAENIDPPRNLPPSISPEDWDSDDYWVPCHQKLAPPYLTPWMAFIKKKMEEGNFCPIDAHAVSIAEKVRYEKMLNPTVYTAVEGQFDDCSSDDS